MMLSLEACRSFLSIRLGRWEFFVEPKASPAYDKDHDRGPFAVMMQRFDGGRYVEMTLEVPFLALYWVKHRL
jgi:hypothetical protein